MSKNKSKSKGRRECKLTRDTRCYTTLLRNAGGNSEYKNKTNLSDTKTKKENKKNDSKFANIHTYIQEIWYIYICMYIKFLTYVYENTGIAMCVCGKNS